MTPRPAVGRIADPADEDAIYRCLLGLEFDNGLGFPHDEETVREAIRQGTDRKGGFVVVIDDPEDPGEVAATLGVHWGRFWYSRDHYLSETWLFVRPERRRGTGYAEALMAWAAWFRAQLEEAAGREVPFFTAVNSRKRLATKMRWWRRRGELIGGIYLLK